MEGPTSLISRIHNIFSDGIHFAAPISSLQTNEVDLVRGILQIIQGNSSSFFGWDEIRQRFYTKAGIYVTHLSQSSLHGVLSQFLYAASCLRLVQDVVSKVEISVRSSPTLRAFASSASAWLKRLRDIALKEEVKISESDRAIPTLLGLASTLSSLCSGAEYLLQIVNEAVPQAWIESIYSIPAAEVAVHILDLLYKKINEVCLVRGGEEEAYQMLLYLFVGSLLPLIESIDSWLYEGILDDPFEEMYFYENKVVSISDAEFWEKSYLVRSCSYQKLGSEIMGVAHEHQACPFFVKDIAKAIISAGKSLQLIRHVPMTLESTAYTAGGHSRIDGFESSSDAAAIGELHRGLSSARLTLSEVFCVSLSGLLDHGDRVYNYIWQDNYPPFVEAKTEGLRLQERDADRSPALIHKGKIWFEFLNETLRKRGYAYKDTRSSSHLEDDNAVLDLTNKQQITKSYWPENPVITVCHELLNENTNAWTSLNLSRNYHLPPLNDEDLREAIFGPKTGITLSARGTDYSFGFQFNKSEYLRCEDDNKFMEQLFPFPTILPTFQDNLRMSELLPFQRNSTLSSRILSWIEVAEPKGTPLPMVIVQECLNVYIKKQVDYIGSHMLSKLLNEWRLMDELGVLRAIYLLGSGDLLQHFLAVLFNKLDEGKSWDDDFELNMILQESITNSADGMLLSAPDSLVVSIVKPSALDGSDQQIPSSLIATPRIGHEPGLGISGLDVLNFTYKVSWPLELIANSEAIKKYNQVMRFLIKVKRAKFVLDKARRWIWKGRGTVTVNCKHRWLVEQKLMHFVDAFHNYVMDRVYHSAWRELCKGMAAARSLDEVIEVHDTYLLTIQRQCFVVPDKLWALIASRINSILGLALDFYSIQKTLNSSGTVSAIKARCEMEVDRIEKQFDDCIAFLLRVLSFKLNVGHFPHLADLVTRINYNYYYMSDNGNMITAPGSDTIKLGKPFPSRSG